MKKLKFLCGVPSKQLIQGLGIVDLWFHAIFEKETEQQSFRAHGSELKGRVNSKVMSQLHVQRVIV